MKVLWITNILLPDINQFLGGSYNPAGGWMLSLAENLKEVNNIDLSVASVTPLAKDLVIYDNDCIRYYAIPLGRGNLEYNNEYCRYWQHINEDFKPDVVHIHGTEFTHGLSYVDVCGVDNVVVSIQGLLTEIAKYSKGGLTHKDIVKNITLRDLISKTDLISESKKYRNRSKWERVLLSKVKHVIGRTDWDKKCTLAVNPNLNYYSVNESMRDVFYSVDLWDYSTCKKLSIFLSQASCALKGAHFVFKALVKVLEEFPDATIRIAGSDITKRDTLRDYLKQTNYSKYLRRLMKELNIQDKITFVGVLTAEEMKAEYLSANVFICPSSIENSPNSVGEAQLLGVPILASNVGGVSSIIDASQLYEYDHISSLSLNIINIFKKSDKLDNHDQYMSAKQRYDVKENISQLLDVYSAIN